MRHSPCTHPGEGDDHAQGRHEHLGAHEQVLDVLGLVAPVDGPGADEDSQRYALRQEVGGWTLTAI